MTKVQIRTGKTNVFQLALLFASLVTGGLGMVFGSPGSRAVQSTSPGGWVLGFYIITFLCALIALVGTWGPVRLEVGGLIGLCAVWTCFGSAVFYFAGPQSTGAWSLIAFGLACGARCIQIKYELRQSRGLNALIEPTENDDG